MLNTAEGWRMVFQDYFDNEAPKSGWVLSSKEFIPDSTSKNYLEQTEIIIKYLKEVVFKGQKIPEKYQEAIKEFESKKSSISKLIDTDWQKAAKQLASLEIDHLCR